MAFMQNNSRSSPEGFLFSGGGPYSAKQPRLSLSQATFE